jgi:cell division protein FtsW
MSMINRVTAELRGDKVIWAIVGILALFSVLAVYSSTSALAFQGKTGNTEYYLIKQMLILGLGLVITYLFYLIHYKRFSVWAPYMLLITIPLLLLTQMFGIEINNATRWLEIPGIGLTFQPSDFAKIAIITYVARSISAKQEYITDFQSAFLPLIVPVILICLLIAISNLSTALVIFVTCLTMMFVGRVAGQYIFLLIFCGIVAFAGLIVIGKAFPETGVRVNTWVSRLKNWTGEEENSDKFQVKASKMAIANGGMIGKGPGNSVQKNFLPMAYTDYIYSVIIEEYGLLGGGFLMFLFVLLFMRVVRLVTIGSKTFPAMLAMGLTIIIVMQALANMAVAVDLVPVTGLSIPMVGHGGTSLLFSCVAFGMILSVSKHIEDGRDLPA